MSRQSHRSWRGTHDFIELTYCHDRFPNTTIREEKIKKKNDPLIQMLKIVGWNVNPLITVRTWVRGVVHKQSLEALNKLKIHPHPFLRSQKTHETHTSNCHKIPHTPRPKLKIARQQPSSFDMLS